MGFSEKLHIIVVITVHCKPAGRWVPVGAIGLCPWFDCLVFLSGTCMTTLVLWMTRGVVMFFCNVSLVNRI